MSRSLVDMAKAYVDSETPNRRQRAEERIKTLKEKYDPGGGWQLIEPGPLWEAGLIWLEETRQFGLDTVNHVLQHQNARSLPGKSAEVEAFRRYMHDWALREQEEYIIPSLQAFMDERGVKQDVKRQQLGNTKERLQWEMAQAVKEFLTRIHEAGQAA